MGKRRAGDAVRTAVGKVIGDRRVAPKQCPAPACRGWAFCAPAAPASLRPNIGTVTYFANPDSRKIGGKIRQANNLRHFGLQKTAGLWLEHNR